MLYFRFVHKMCPVVRNLVQIEDKNNMNLDKINLRQFSFIKGPDTFFYYCNVSVLWKINKNS